MPFQPNNKLARGGRRPGAGRKPTDVKQMREEAAADAFERIKELTRDIDAPPAVQLQAAVYVVNRVEGPPTQSSKVELTGKDGGPVETKAVEVIPFDYDRFAAAFDAFARTGVAAAPADHRP